MYMSDHKCLGLTHFLFICRLGIRACLLLVPLLGLTWLFGLLSPLHIAFAYIFTISNTTQVIAVLTALCFVLVYFIVHSCTTPGRDKTSCVETKHEIITSNCRLYGQFSLLNLCGRESLCDIKRDCCYHFVSERDFRRDAQRDFTGPLNHFPFIG